MNKYEQLGIPIRKKSIVIPNGVDILEIRKTSKRILKGDFKLFFPGGEKLWKGGDLLVESLSIIKREIPGIHLYITGNVPKKNVIMKLVRNNKLERNISILGFLEPKRNLEVLNSTDLLVFPSKREAFGIVLLEAMALGKPIVTTKMGGIPEVVKDKRNGIFVKRDPRAIAEAVVYLFKNKKVYEEMSLNNLNDAEKFDWKKIVNKYVEVYKTCTSSKD
jgi:glycosyltransferase involved in cell wall biosynthesis